MKPEVYGAFRLTVSQYLAGSKAAYLFTDGVLLISPAMMELIKDYDESKNLEWLLARIPVKQIPFPAEYKPWLS